MLIASFAVQKLLSSIRPHLLISVFISFALGDRILEEHIEALTGFSHVYRPDGLNITLLSEGCIPAMTPAMKMVARTYIPRGGSEESPIAWVQLTDQPTGSHALLMEDQSMLEPGRHSFSSRKLSSV